MDVIAIPASLIRFTYGFLAYSAKVTKVVIIMLHRVRVISVDNKQHYMSCNTLVVVFLMCLTR